MSLLSYKKFPKAAQRRIEQLEAEVARLKTELLPETKAASNVLLADVQEETALPKDSTIRFIMSKKDKYESIDVSHSRRRGGLEVYWRGSRGRIAVVPEAGNVVRIVLVPYET